MPFVVFMVCVEAVPPFQFRSDSHASDLIALLFV
jgi:hypothetical protein